CYTVDNPESLYYDSEIFTKVLAFVTKNSSRISMKQTPKNILITINGVRNMLEANALLQKINL
ncbi:MAG: hypothetical protein LH629_01800, partial [Ignavibacteria bacterium]|nr:hypothetical protein [Ignavibacteria bacterium]